MNDKKVNMLLEAFGELEDDILEEAANADDIKTLKEAVRNDSKTIRIHSTLRTVVAAIIAIAVVVASFITVDKLNLFMVDEPADNSSAHANISSSQTSSKKQSDEKEENMQSEPEDDHNNGTTSKYDDTYSNNNSSNYSSHHSGSDGFAIKSLDMLNFYSVKQVVSEMSFLPISTVNKPLAINTSKVVNYPINPSAEFIVTMVTYFQIELKDERGFLAQKLGGTGVVEVAITENNLENMITFKRGDRYYSCLLNGASYDSDGSLVSYRFSTHKYIEGFNIIKDFEQDNFLFTVLFQDNKVVGIESAWFNDEDADDSSIDEISLIEDYCVVMFTKRSFTISQLEVYFKNQTSQQGV